MSRPRKKVARRKRSAAARLRPFWILLILLVIAGGAGGYYVATWPGFRPRHIVVVGNHRVSTHAIAARAAIDRRENLWLQNTQAAAVRVAALPDIGQVTIRRGFPAALTIVVTERVPYAQIRAGAETGVVDRDLRVLQAAVSPALPQFIVRIAVPAAGRFIKDERVTRLRDDYENLADAHVVVAALRYDRFGDLTAVTPRGVELLLGDDEDLARKIALIGPILSQTAGRKIAAIDLRAPGTPVVVYRR
jgi:cell division septal protein FtsQ